MGYRPTVLGNLVYTDPDKARAALDEGLRTHGGITAAAAALGVDRHTLQRWVSILGMTAPVRARRGPPPDPNSARSKKTRVAAH